MSIAVDEHRFVCAVRLDWAGCGEAAMSHDQAARLAGVPIRNVRTIGPEDADEATIPWGVYAAIVEAIEARAEEAATLFEIDGGTAIICASWPDGIDLTGAINFPDAGVTLLLVEPKPERVN